MQRLEIISCECYKTCMSIIEVFKCTVEIKNKYHLNRPEIFVQNATFQGTLYLSGEKKSTIYSRDRHAAIANCSAENVLSSRVPCGGKCIVLHYQPQAIFPLLQIFFRIALAVYFPIYSYTSKSFMINRLS